MMSALYNWLFHYNSYTGLWSAFQREHLQDYFNGDLEKIIQSPVHKTLEELIIANDGDLVRIKRFISALNS